MIDKNIIQKISKINNEPEWLLNSRLKAYENIQNSLTKYSRRLDFSKFDLENYNFSENGLYNFYEDILHGKITNAIFSKSKEFTQIQNENNFVKIDNLNNIIFKDVKTILQEAPDLFKKYFLTSKEFAYNEKLSLYNQALWKNGYFLYVPANIVVNIPINNLFIQYSDGKANFLNNFIILGENSKLSFIDSQVSSNLNNDSLVNNQLNVFVSSGAILDYVGIQEFNSKVNFINKKYFHINANARVNWFEIVLGGKTVKNEFSASLNASGSEVYMQGLFLAGRDQQMEFNTSQLHNVGFTKSDLLYIGTLRENARTSYEGLIRVNKGAQKTDAYQKNKNLLLSKEAHADSEPLLEIQANDVRCTHGATVAPVNADDLFYLMSRGIEKDLAKKILISGFFSEIIEKLPFEELKEAIQLHIEKNI